MVYIFDANSYITWHMTWHIILDLLGIFQHGLMYYSFPLSAMDLSPGFRICLWYDCHQLLKSLSHPFPPNLSSSCNSFQKSLSQSVVLISVQCSHAYSSID